MKLKIAYLSFATNFVYGEFFNITGLWNTLSDRIFWNILNDEGVASPFSATDAQFNFIDDFMTPNSNCWCYPVKQFAPKHEVQDDYDSDCHVFHRCLGCCSITDGTCNTLSQELELDLPVAGRITVTNNAGQTKILTNSSIIVPQDATQCYQNMATCWADYEASVTQMIRDNANFNALTFGNSYSKTCNNRKAHKKPGKDPGQHDAKVPAIDQCCGIAPVWYPFSTEEGAKECCGSTVINLSNQECCNGNVIDIPTCTGNDVLNTTVVNGCNEHSCGPACCDVACLEDPDCSEPNHSLNDRIVNGCPVRECILVCPVVAPPNCNLNSNMLVPGIVDHCEVYTCEPIVCEDPVPMPPSTPDPAVLCNNDGATPTIVTDVNGCDDWVCMCFDPVCLATQGENQTDFVVILDESGSVGAANFDVMRQFANYFIDALPLESNGARMLIYTYSSFNNVLFDFEDSVNMSKQQLKDLVNGHAYSGGSTLTYLPLEDYRDTTSNDPFNRQDVKDVILLLTDGASTDQPRLYTVANFIKQDMQTEIYAIGIGGYNLVELLNVASQPTSKYLKEIDTFADLENVANELVLDVCPLVECTGTGRDDIPWIENEVQVPCTDELVC